MWKTDESYKLSNMFVFFFFCMCVLGLYFQIFFFSLCVCGGNISEFFFFLAQEF